MLRTPTDLERESLVHFYDPRKAHEYYLRTRELHGRKSGGGTTEASGRTRAAKLGTAKSSRAKQRQELQDSIQRLTKKLDKLNALIREKQHAEASENRKSKAKKERAAKEKDKPKTAAEKAAAARENKKYRDKNQQKVQSKAKEASSSGGGDSKKSSTDTKKASVSELKSLATKVNGQIAVAKQKLAAL